MNTQEKVERCIREHCHNLARKKSDQIASFASHVIAMHENALEIMGFQDDADELSIVLEKLKEAAEVVSALSPHTMTRINSLIPLLLNEREGQFGSDEFVAKLRNLPKPPTLTISPSGPEQVRLNNGVFQARYEAIESMIEGVIAAELEQHSKQKRRVDRNLEGPVVVAACLKVWREDLGGDYRNPTSATEPQKSFRNNAEPDIKTFVSCVFSALEVNWDVRGSFERLRAMGGEEAVILNLKI